MQRLGLSGLFMSLLITAAACGGSSGPPGSPNPPGGGGGNNGTQIRGNERLGWTQGPTDAVDLSAVRYAAYLDNNRVSLPDVSCSPSGGSLSCTSRLPAMNPGAHTIEVISFVMDGDNTIESPRSAALNVTLIGSTTGADPAPSSSPRTPVLNTELVTNDGVRLGIQLVRDGLESPSAIAFAPDGRIFIGERQGRVRVLEGGATESEPSQLDDIVATSATDGGLLGLALDPDFAQSHGVYALYTVAGRDGGTAFRLAKFRETGGVLGQRAVLLDGVDAAALASGSLAVGADGKIYAAFDDGGDAAKSDAFGSYNGKVLRLNLDGTTPADQPSKTPVYSSGYRAPKSLDWQTTTKSLWVADDREANDTLVVLTAPSQRSPRAIVQNRLPLPQRVESLAFYRGDLISSFKSDLLVAAQSGELVRLRFDPRNASRVASTEPLPLGDGVKVNLVAIGADQAVYIATNDALLRLAPKR
jgi:glucose/arabinose dehydrogenase